MRPPFSETEANGKWTREMPFGGMGDTTDKKFRVAKIDLTLSRRRQFEPERRRGRTTLSVTLWVVTFNNFRKTFLNDVGLSVSVVNVVCVVVRRSSRNKYFVLLPFNEITLHNLINKY